MERGGFGNVVSFAVSFAGLTESQSALFGGIHGARKCAAGTEGRAATLGSYGMSQRAREVARMVPDAWQSTWVGYVAWVRGMVHVGRCM